MVPASAVAQVSFYSAPPAGSPSVSAPSASAKAAAPSDTGDAKGGGVSLGTGIFSRNPFSLTAAVREGFDNNVFTTNTDEKSSFYTNIAAGLNYSFGSPRLSLNTGINGGVTYYYTRPGDKVDFNGQLFLNAVYLATPRLTLSIATSTAYLSQPDLSILGSTNRQNGDYLYSSTVISAGYQWSQKFSTVTSYTLNIIYYLDNGLNQVQGHIDQTISQSALWLLLPKTALVAEYRANPVTYYDADLDSFNNFFLVGFDQVFNPRLKWSLRGGIQVGFDENPVDGSSIYVGPYGESTVSYQFAPASSVVLNLRYGTEASGITDVTQRETFRAGFALVHGFTPRLSASLGLSYQVNHYDQSSVINSFYENVLDIAVGLNYKINRFTSISAGYQFTIDSAPDWTGRDYTRDVVYVGANFGF